MKKLFILLAVFYIIGGLFFFNFLSNKKENEKKIININNIKESIVIIIPENKLISYKENPKWLFEEYKISWIWAWFFIDKEWTIQTVNHILENDKINYKIIYQNKEYQSKILYRNKKDDLAQLKIISKTNINFSYLKSSNNYFINEKLISFWINPQNLKVIYNTWIIINKKSKLDKKSNLLEISNTLKPGFSWWPIINYNWKVIWINYAISEWKNYWMNLTKNKKN